MGRADPSVLFSQSFVHAQLDEYVDEVLFAEPVVITACEFLEHNASPSTPTVSLVGATSPPSFAVEVFVHCEGEPRFRRLCPAFLYSHSSSNFLELEAVVTNRLVVRGSYRSLTLVIYGNTAEDLGQFNIELDLDSSLVNLVSSPSEEKLEDLPSVLHSTKLPIGESISCLISLSLPVIFQDISKEIKEFLLVTLKICQFSVHEETICKLMNSVVSAISSYISCNFRGVVCGDFSKVGNTVKGRNQKDVTDVLIQARSDLLELLRNHGSDLQNCIRGSVEDVILVDSEELVTSEQLVSMYNKCSKLSGTSSDFVESLSQNKFELLKLGVVLLLCSARESCFHFVMGGGMKNIVHMLCQETHRSATNLLMLLVVIEHATRHAIGCEGFLGWWPREDENVPVGTSDGYSHLLNLLLQKSRHDVVSLATYILHRLRLYEILSRYECSVLSVLDNLSSNQCITADMSHSLLLTNSILRKILKLINFDGNVEDPSPVSSLRTSVIGQTEGLSYKATLDFIASSKYSFGVPDINTHLLFLLKERGFFPLSAALLSLPILRSASDNTIDIFVDITSSVELIFLSLLHCRSGLTFLLLQPEAVGTIILSLKGNEDVKTTDCLTCREAAVLISKGYFCPPEEIGMILDLHLKVVHAIDRLLATASQSEEQLWLLWDLCAISRSDSGRQALLVIGRFPEAIEVLLEALRSSKDKELTGANDGGTSPLSLVVFHCAAEIFEVLVTDSAASSLSSWIGHAVELHEALHSSSPGSSRKDAPTRLLEWIEGGVVYHKNGATGLLRYAAILASGGDAHLTSGTILESDSMDVENVIGDPSNGSDSHIIDNLLGKLVSDKYFYGLTLQSTSIVQLTTTFRILAFISEKPAVAAALYEEGAVSLIYVVLVNCKFMLERLSNNYDYLVDEGAECNATSDLLLERFHEQSLVDLLLPALVLLNNLLQKLKEAKVHYRNTKLLNALLKLHREISPKVVVCAAELSLPYPSSALRLHAVCRLLVSALTCWPIFGWAPGLFHCLLGNDQSTSLLTLGPKDGCSLLCLLADLCPEEGIWLWKNGMPALSTLRSLSIGTVLGSQGESYVDWYMQPDSEAILFGRLKQQLDQISQIVLHFSFTALNVLQDALRVFIVRLACRRIEFASDVLQPVISWVDSRIHESSLSDIDVYKVCRLLSFIAGLLEHPQAMILLMKDGIYRILVKVLQRCCEAAVLDGKVIHDGTFQPKTSTTMLSWCLPVFKSLSLIFYSDTSMDSSDVLHKQNMEKLIMEENCIVWRHLLAGCQLLPVGKELLACLVTLKDVASCSVGRSALLSMFRQIKSNSFEILPGLPDEYNLNSYPLLSCWKKLLRSFDGEGGVSHYAVEAIHLLSFGASCLSIEDKSPEGLKILKYLFGLPYDPVEDEVIVFDEKLKDLHDTITLFDHLISGETLSVSYEKMNLHEVKESVVKLLEQLRRPSCSSMGEEDAVSIKASVSTGTDNSESTQRQHLAPSSPAVQVDDLHDGSSVDVWKVFQDAEKANEFFVGGFSDNFIWTCPDSSVDRLMASSLHVKRKLSLSDGSNRRVRDNAGFETVGPNAFSRGVVAPSITSGPSRRDTFRQRKPNTSRPPSMHVDDYVARERNVDGVSSNINIMGSSRGGSTSGRPPSIHVDEFMARERERQNPIAGAVGETTQVKNAPLENSNGIEKSDTSLRPKTHLDDDLHELDIVFDEESESDDKLSFPQPDGDLQPAPVIAAESSPGSIVEESEGDVNGVAQSEFISETSASRPEKELFQELNVSSDKNMRRPNTKKSFFHERSDESKYVSPVNRPDNFLAKPSNEHPPNMFTQQMVESQLPSSSFYPKGSPQKTPSISSPAGSQGYYEQKVLANQPPLPPMPPPILSSISPQAGEPYQNHQVRYGHSRDVQPPLPAGFPSQGYDSNPPKTEAVLPANSIYMASLDKYSWPTVSPGSRLHETSTSNASARSLPPLPPMPPPYPSSSMPQSSVMNSSSQTSGQFPPPSALLNDPRLGLFATSGNGSFNLSQYTSPLMLAKSASNSAALIGSSPQQQGLNFSGFSVPFPTPSSSIQSIQAQPPPPPPQLPRPPNPSQHLRQPFQVSQAQTEMVSLQHNTIQMQQVQVPQQQLQVPHIHVYYQAQQDSLLRMPQPNEQAESLNLHGQSESMSEQQQDPGAVLQQYFASPEAIQSLLSDRDKLCQLLEQHPKLMQMLQERLGQL